MFDPIDPKELQQALYASAAAVSEGGDKGTKSKRKRDQQNSSDWWDFACNWQETKLIRVLIISQSFIEIRI